MTTHFFKQRPQEKPMTQYLDKHGTEIRIGDVVRYLDGDEFPVLRFGGEKDTPVWVSEDRRCAPSALVVLSRADGSPVFRYADGRDVRTGDVTEHMDHAPPPDNMTDANLRAWYSRCRLLRRADSPRELSSTAVVAQRAELAAKPKTLEDAVREAFKGRSILDELRPVLGKDRNGREVRRGDRVRCVCGSPICGSEPFAVHSSDTWHFLSLRDGQGIRNFVHFGNAELVTDEKAEQCYCEPPTPEELERRGYTPEMLARFGAEKAEQCAGKVGSKPCHLRVGHGGPHMIEMTYFERLRYSQHVKDPGPVCDAIESLCRALAGPTRAERYAEFRQTVASIISTSCAGLDVEAVTDVAKEQFLLRLRIGPDWEQLLWWPSRGPWEAVRAEINRSVKIVEIELGREALEKARVLGKGRS